jgi:ribosomal-protein-alanine N-acetyltransferase
MTGPSLLRLDVESLRGLVAERPVVVEGVTLTPYVHEHRWLWELRLPQVLEDPASLDWIARVAVVPGLGLVGLVGFHGPPDERGTVEVSYGVDPAFRRQGWARVLLAAALEWAASAPEVRAVRASISPDNEASLATLRPFGFEQVGEQWDEVDGLELVFERAVDR